jgi:hypothetical protein
MSRTTAVWSWLAIVAGAGVCLALIAVSVKLNYTFGLSRGEGEELRQLYGFAFASADVLKVGMPIAIGLALRARNTTLVVIGSILFAVCTVASLAAAFGLMAQSRASLASATEARALSLSELRAELAADRTRLTALGWSRPVAQVEGDLAAERQSKRWETTKDCAEATAGDSRTFCANYERLKGELAAAGEAQALRARIDAASARLAGLDLAASLKPADPQVASLAALSGVAPSRIEAALSILIAVLIEAASGWGPFVVVESGRLVLREGRAKAEVLVSGADPQPSVETPKSAPATHDSKVSARRPRASARKVSQALKRKLSPAATRPTLIRRAIAATPTVMTLEDDTRDACDAPPRDSSPSPGDDTSMVDPSRGSLADRRRRPANDILAPVTADSQVSASLSTGVLGLSADDGSVRDLLAARTRPEPGTRMQARPLYDAYADWCRTHNRPVVSLTRFGRAITAAGVEKETGARVHYLDLSLVA